MIETPVETTDMYVTLSNHWLIILLPVAPVSVSLSPSTTPVIEGVDDLILTCSVDEAGNPTQYTYYWRYPTGDVITGATGNTLNIPGSELNATLHDGTWQCVAGNVVGNSTTGTADITVNGKMPIIVDKHINDC